MKMLLIDGDIILYRACFASSFVFDWNDCFSNTCDARQAKSIIKNQVENFCETFGTIATLFFTGRRNWRHEICPTYKMNRADLTKPAAFHEVKAWCKREFLWSEEDGLEADDLMGIIATKNSEGEHPPIIISPDKDMLGVPGLLLNPDKSSEVQEISQASADYWHLFQTLTGDRSDGYSGCPGIGPAKAKQILAKDPSWGAVVEAYKKAGLTEEEASIQGSVARVLRSSDWDEKTESRRWKLWNYHGGQ